MSGTAHDTSGRPGPRAVTADPSERCIRDMMGLIALPALWAGRDGPSILQIMSEAIGRVVAFDFCFLQVILQAGESEYCLARVRPGLEQPTSYNLWNSAAQQWRATTVPDGRAFEADTPLGQLQVVGLSLGFGNHGGKIWFGARDPSFPSHHQLALLRAATSLVATGLQAARVNEGREQASRAKDEFLAMLAHELRNPLAPISAAAELLLRTEPDRERVKKVSAVIARQSRHMTGLIDDLLDVSRVTRRLIVLDQHVLDLSKVITEAVEQARPLLDSRRHKLAVDLLDEPVGVSGDHKRLVQVLSNLLNNAAKYTPEGGDIALSLRVQPDFAIVTVTDNGVGMSADLVKRAFDLFTQAQRSADRAQGGLGIGLALVKSLVELHGGTVGASSSGPGLGSTFTVRLPRVAHMAAPERAAILPIGLAGASLHVMIVDDNIDAAHMLGKFLESQGHVVHVEHDSAAALAAAARMAPHVFLLDIGLPGMDGYELARRLRDLPNARTAMLIAITGYGGPQDRARTAGAGFDHHFVKPVDLLALSGVLARR